MVGRKKPSFWSWGGGKGAGPLEQAGVMMWRRLQQQRRRSLAWPGPQESPPETRQSLNGIQQEGQQPGQSLECGPENGGPSGGMLEKEDAEPEMRWTHCWTLSKTKQSSQERCGVSEIQNDSSFGSIQTFKDVLDWTEFP